MPTVIDLQAIGDAPGTVETVVQTLLEGGVVGLPFEWTYGRAIYPWAGSGESSAQRAGEKALSATPDVHCVLVFRDVAAMNDAFGSISGRAARLVRRCWPGPVLVEVIEETLPTPVERLNEPMRRGVCHEDSVRITIPTHSYVRRVLNALPGPLLVALPAKTDDCHKTATAILECFNDELDILVDDGPVRYDQPPTRVKIEGGRWWITEEGVLSAKAIQRMASQVIIFVCTGNTCRSPMAEALCRRRLSEKLHCADDELLDHGFAVLSAGLSAVQGSPANPEAVSLLETFGVGLHDHESQPLTRELIAHADWILTMTKSHRDQIVAEVPGASGKVRLLSPEGRDLSDPLGGGPNEYQECCSRITSDLDVLVEELLGGEEKVN